MKVLQINAVSGIRSTGRTCVEIADYLNKNGDEGYIAYSEGPSYIKGYKIGLTFEKKIHGLLSRICGTQAYFSKIGTRKLINYMERIKPDVVHLRNLHGNYINLELLLTYLAENDIPTVLTLHDCWFYTGKCSHYTVDNCCKWQTECFDCPRIHKDNPSWFLDRTKKMHRDKKNWFSRIPRLAVVGVSDWIANEAKKSLLSSAKIVTRIYNWIDLDAFKPVSTDKLRYKLGLENKFIILGVASGWSNNKGLNKFVELAGLITEDMIIILMGAMKVDVELPANIIHIQETHDVDELVKYYSMADVLVNFSPEESFGKVTAEALACGTPAIVINSTANPELVGEGCGYIVEKDDIEKIVEHIFTIQSRGKSCYTRQCIKYVKNNFSKDDRIKDYLKIYRQITKEDGDC
jgi:glycosyltransferase involved in cell wall biosynthesis